MEREDSQFGVDDNLNLEVGSSSVNASPGGVAVLSGKQRSKSPVGGITASVKRIFGYTQGKKSEHAAKKPEGESQSASRVTIPASLRFVLLTIVFLALGTLLWLGVNLLPVDPTAFARFRETARLDAWIYIGVPPSLPDLFKYLPIFAGWLLRVSMAIAASIYYFKDRREDDEDGDVKVVYMGLLALLSTFVFPNTINALIQEISSAGGIDLGFTAASLRVPLVIVVLLLAAWRSFEGRRDLTSMYVGALISGMLFLIYKEPVVSLVLLVFATPIAVYELLRESTDSGRLGVLSQAVGIVGIFVVSYAVVWEMFSYASLWLTHPATEGIRTTIVYNLQPVSVAVAYFASRLFSGRLLKTLEWCAKDKNNKLGKFFAARCSCEHENDLVLTLILLLALAMAFSQFV